MDIFQRKVWYTHEDTNDYRLMELDLDYVNDIILKNQKDIIVNQLDTQETTAVSKKADFKNVVGQDSINRFDTKRKRSKRFRKNRTKHRKPKN